MDEQIRFWQGVEDGHVASFWFGEEIYPSPARQPPQNPNVKTRPGLTEHYKKLGGQLGRL
jgi:hypothetical protein